MREFDEKSITQAGIGRRAECDDPRFKRVMTALITRLHDFVREVRLTEPEWLEAIQFLIDVGKTCTEKRQEFILLSDTLGVSVLVITVNHPADGGSVESTVERVSGFGRRVRDKGIADCEVRAASARNRSRRRAPDNTVLYGRL
jgi:hydroxyquinol 1,2-dioxygenase